MEVCAVWSDDYPKSDILGIHYGTLTKNTTTTKKQTSKPKKPKQQQQQQQRMKGWVDM